MRFCQLDRILDIQENKTITAVKGLTLSEEYLKDHFPRLPVMPGVLMLEAMYQAAAWLVRISEDYRHSMVVLKEARSVKYADFVEPGKTLTVTAAIVKQDEQTTTFKAHGIIGEQTKEAVSGRLVLERFNVAQRYPECTSRDEYIRQELRSEFALLYPGKYRNDAAV